jgi:osmoprotectant transport system substrate-binding protein
MTSARRRHGGRAVGTCARLLCVLLLVAFAACSSDPKEGDAGTPGAIRVGAFDFPESQVLAHIYAIALAENGYPADLLENVATREIMEPALEQGKVDLVPEYLGTALAFIRPDSGLSQITQAATHASLRQAFSERGVSVLSAAPGENKNEIAVTPETATRYGLSKISDLGDVAPELVFGGPPECPTRPHCLAGLQSAYGLEFGRFTPLDAGGPLTVSALRSGEIDVALLFTTTPAIDEFDLVVLDDDRRLQPAENVVPVVRNPVMEASGADLEALLDRVTKKLTTTTLRTLNQRMSESDAPEVAREWLIENGLVSE